MGYGWIRGVKHLPDQDQQETIDGEMPGIGGMVKALPEADRADMAAFRGYLQSLHEADKEACGNLRHEKCASSFLCYLQVGREARCQCSSP